VADAHGRTREGDTVVRRGAGVAKRGVARRAAELADADIICFDYDAIG
jgi:hypothetical protein